MLSGNKDWKRTRMNLFRNGYIVASIRDYGCFAYDVWPLDTVEEKTAVQLTEEADEKWFIAYDMLQIAPDLDYAVRYAECCRKNGIEAVILLAETPDDAWVVKDEIRIEEVYGFDCIGAVGFSYLRTDFGTDVSQVRLNRYGLFDTLEEVESYVEKRREVIASGVNIEDFWKETPIRLSRVKPGNE